MTLDQAHAQQRAEARLRGERVALEHSRRLQVKDCLSSTAQNHVDLLAVFMPSIIRCRASGPFNHFLHNCVMHSIHSCSRSEVVAARDDQALLYSIRRMGAEVEI